LSFAYAEVLREVQGEIPSSSNKGLKVESWKVPRGQAGIQEPDGRVGILTGREIPKVSQENKP